MKKTSNFMEKFLEYLEKAEKNIQTADHMTYVTYQLVKEKRLILKILSEINNSTINLINSILQYDYLYKRINLTSDAKTNLNIFLSKSCPRYLINEQEKKNILEIIELNQKHKQSPLEFVRNGKIVIMSENLRTDVLTIEKIKQFILTIKSILEKTKKRMSHHF